MHTLLLPPSHEQWLGSKKRVTLSTGITLSYIQCGNPTGQPLLLLHGYADSCRLWRPVMLHLYQSYHIYALDLRGHGQSDAPKQFAYSISQMAEDVQAFITQLELGPCHLIGHSMGSMVSQAVAFSNQCPLQSLTLVSTMAHLHEQASDVLALKKGFIQREKGLPEQARETLFPTYPLLDQQDPDMLDALLAEKACWPAHCVSAAWWGMSMAEHRTMLQFITAPTLIVWGEDDELFFQEHQQEVRQQIPNHHFVALPGITHLLPLEAPATLAQAFQDFLCP